MRRRDRHPLPADVQRDLDAMDAAIAGRAPDGDLATLALAVRDQRPRPDAGVTARLDEHVERGLAASAAPPRARRLLAPALGVAGALLLTLVAGVAVLGGHDQGGGQVALERPTTTTTTTAPATGAAPSDAARAEREVAPGVTAAPPVGAPSPTPTPTPTAPGRSVERGAQLSLATAPGRLDDVAGDVVRTVDALRGYVVSSSVESRAAAGSATFDLRVPSAQLQPALARLSKLATVRSRSETSLDVTGQVDAARERLDALRAERRGVLRQLAAATTPAETAAARGRLRIVDARITRAEAQRAALRRRTAYSAIALEVATERPRAGGTAGGGDWTPRDALGDALRVLSVAFGVALVAFAALLPAALLAAAGFGMWRVVTARRRRGALSTH